MFATFFPAAQLYPISGGELAAILESTTGMTRVDDAARLASLPVRLEVAPPRPATDLPSGHLWTLGGAWSALLLALSAGAVALRSSFAYGDKHRRFTHAVTHELRTPLTTFRMYSEMLSKGMVPEASRPEYLRTLESESARLSDLVENVLRYARLEESGQAASLELIDAHGLLERCVPELARTCDRSGATLEIQDQLEPRPDGQALQLRTDASAVLQILSNLVDNACKYGRTPQTPEGDAGGMAPDDSCVVVLRARCNAGQVRLEVLDSGPGVPAQIETAIFQPFDRGGRDASDPAPGVGLGLALARDLARELGGELMLLPTARGAAFRLSLPAEG